jgi:hypothetical protein
MSIPSLFAQRRRDRRSTRRNPVSRLVHLERLDDRVHPSFLAPISTPNEEPVLTVGDFNKDGFPDVVS